MRLHRSILAAAGAAVGLATAARAQDSPFGIRGLGIPGRFESARARATGGAFAALDALSGQSEASVADIRSLTATAVGANSFLADEIGGQRETRRTGRFPLFQVLGPVWHGVNVSVGFTTYLDRSYRVLIPDTLTLDGSRQAVIDLLSSDGGVSDLRLVAARRFGPLALGAGFHLLAGSTRMEAQRTFADTSSYQTVLQTGEIAYSGAGASASAILTLRRRLSLTVFYRSDGRLRGEEGSRTVSRTDLPVTVGGAVGWWPAPEARFAASLIRRNWSTAADSGAFNTTSWSAGMELGSARLPLRLGVRGGELPFGPGGAAPREFAVAAGSGLTVAGGLGAIDFTLERLRRTGDGLTETAWTVLVGLTLRPTVR